MQSVNRALDVLFHLADATDPASAASIARGVDLPRPTVYRILDTLVARQLVAKEATGFVVVEDELRRLVSH
jgi:DNA-binding IclR family transcriptional regulator